VNKIRLAQAHEASSSPPKNEQLVAEIAQKISFEKAKQAKLMGEKTQNKSVKQSKSPDQTKFPHTSEKAKTHGRLSNASSNLFCKSSF